MLFPPGDTLLDYSTVAFATKDVGWAFTSSSSEDSSGGYPYKIFKTTDGGYHWLNQYRAFATGFVSYWLLFTLDSLHCWGVGAGFLSTSDGGEHWKHWYADSSTFFPSPPSRQFTAIHFFMPQEGIGFADYRWFTGDGGVHWFRGDTNDTLIMPSDVCFPSRAIGWSVQDGGNPTVSEAGLVAKTTDGGISWRYQDHPYPDSSGPVTPSLSAVDFLDTLTGFAVGNNPPTFRSPYILATTDGGEHWARNQLLNGGKAYDIALFDSAVGWFTGNLGKVWQTTDAGATWSVQTTGVSANLHKIFVFRREKWAYAFGPPNTLLSADLSCITSAGENAGEKPLEFSLFQNYPNPFNPSTEIRYHLPAGQAGIPEDSHVTLRVFDVLGREIATLVNETMPTGTYSVSFDASALPAGRQGLSSGVYFYRLTAGSFTQTKKMSVLK